MEVTTVDGVTIAIRVVEPDGSRSGVPLVLLHGTRIPGISEYDLPVPNGSLAEDLAKAGHACFVPDARGYGRSTRPAAMSRPPSESRPIARSIEIVRDVDAAVDELIRATGFERVALMGWGVGATIVLMYAALWPEKVSHLILYNVLYGGGNDHPRYREHPLEDPARPGRFNVAHYGGYSFNSPEELLRKWDQSIPTADKDEWRDPAVAAAFERALLDGDPSSSTRTPPSYRSPNGMLEDSYFMGRGEKLVHASQVYCKVLIIRPGLDYFSRPADIESLRADLVNAEQVVTWEPENTTHYIILDRPERGRTAAIEKIIDFIRR
ncbi:alpha/beta hydrolase [Ancylobacter sp. VNQ12]|uniref:alpha/beta hydrolase n=1 Tax=Ancylobacter sp. VNQ12 TaxID=3400920 RepID=UPI003C2CC472